MSTDGHKRRTDNPEPAPGDAATESRLDFSQLRWDSRDDQIESLVRVHRETIRLAHRKRDWYRQNAARQKTWSKRLRVGALLFAATGGAIPLLTTALTDAQARAVMPWGYIGFALAGACVAWDRYLSAPV